MLRQLSLAYIRLVAASPSPSYSQKELTAYGKLKSVAFNSPRAHRRFVKSSA